MTFAEALLIFSLWASAKGHKTEFWIAIVWSLLAAIVEIGRRVA